MIYILTLAICIFLSPKTACVAPEVISFGQGLGDFSFALDQATDYVNYISHRARYRSGLFLVASIRTYIMPRADKQSRLIRLDQPALFGFHDGD